MSLTVFLAVLCAALFHASWNALIRNGADKVATMLVMTVVQGAIGLVLLSFREMPGGTVWLWLLASGLFHAAYKVFLAFAYEHGDLSRVYPIARGTAPLLVLAISAVFLAEALQPLETAGVLILASGLLLMGRNSLTTESGRRMLPLALASAAMTAGYSIVDGLGARAMGDALGFVAWLFVLDALLFTPAVLVLRGTAIVTREARVWRAGAIAAAFSFGAYLVAVWAMTVAPIALVTALRETSILFAVLIGRFVFKEPFGRTTWAAIGLILCGVVAMRL